MNGQTQTPAGTIHAKMVAVMREVTAIPKGRRNEQQGYQFRGVDDVYAVVQPLLAKQGIGMTSEILENKYEERQSRSGGALVYRILRVRYTFYAEDGSYVTTEVIGEGMDSGDKAANKAMSVAQKYAILQAFCIPTSDVKDPEVDSPHVAAPKPVPAHALAPAAHAIPRAGSATTEQVEQVVRLAGALVAAGEDMDGVTARIHDYVKRRYGKTIEVINDLSLNEADDVIRQLNTMLAKKKPTSATKRAL